MVHSYCCFSSNITLLIIADGLQQQYRLILTIRDDIDDYINVICWGNEEYITSVSTQLDFYDVGKLDATLFDVND